MLRIYHDVITMQRDVRDLCERIKFHDAALATQLRRAAQSVALNVSEGMGGKAGQRRQSYSVALREARECVGALDVAETWGYVEVVPAARDRLEKIAATLTRLVALGTGDA